MLIPIEYKFGAIEFNGSSCTFLFPVRCMRLQAITLQICILLLGLSGYIYATYAQLAPPAATYTPFLSVSLSETPTPWSAASQPSSSATPKAIALQARDERHSTRAITRSTTTDDKTGKTVTIIVTTIVIIRPSPDPNKVIHDGNTYARQQQTKTTTKTQMSDPNDAAIARQLQEDQAALRRMVTILSVVGGVGAIAVVATLIVFTRMRRRKRKQREYQTRQDEQRLSGDSNGGSPVTDTQLMRTISSARGQTYAGNSNNQIGDRNDDGDQGDDDDDEEHYMPAPSAPPAPPFLETLDQAAYNPFSHRRHVISMSLQTAPAPSAPTPKELDAAVDDAPSQAEASSSVLNKPQYPVHTCGHCSHHSRSLPLEPPEAPPPAYTPSAPPLYEYPLSQSPSAPTSSSSSHPPADEARQS